MEVEDLSAEPWRILNFAATPVYPRPWKIRSKHGTDIARKTRITTRGPAERPAALVERTRRDSFLAAGRGYRGTWPFLARLLALGLRCAGGRKRVSQRGSRTD